MNPDILHYKTNDLATSNHNKCRAIYNENTGKFILKNSRITKYIAFEKNENNIAIVNFRNLLRDTYKSEYGRIIFEQLRIADIGKEDYSKRLTRKQILDTVNACDILLTDKTKEDSLPEMTLIIGDLMELVKAANFNVIIHDCYTQKGMPEGISDLLSKEYHEVQQADKHFKINSKGRLGLYSRAIIQSDDTMFIVVNAYTRIRGKIILYSAIEDSLYRIKSELLEFKGVKECLSEIIRIGILLIPESDYRRIEDILKKVFDKNYHINIVHHVSHMRHNPDQ